MKVYGSQEIVEPIKILGEKVLIRTNIERIIKEDADLWQYDEEQISKNEYIAKLEEANITSMLAITELYEMMLGGQ